MRTFFSISALAMALMLGTVGSVAAAGYLKIGDIKGESTDSNHKDWIIIESMSSPLHQPGSGSTGAARRRGETTLGDIVIVRQMDKSTPKLQEAVANGTVFPRAVIDVADPMKPRSYMRYTLTNVMISSYDVNRSADGTVPTEQLSLNYEEIKTPLSAQPTTRKGNVETEFKVEKGEK